MKQLLLKKSTLLSLWVFYLSTLVVSLNYVHFSESSVILILYSVTALIICIGICVFFLSLLSFIGREDDKYIFMIYGLPILVIFKICYLFLIPRDNICLVLAPESHSIHIIDQLTSLFLAFSVLLRTYLLNKSFSDESTNSYKIYTSRKKILAYGGLFVVILMVHYYLYAFTEPGTYQLASMYTSAFCFLWTIYLYISRKIWKVNLYEFSILLVIIGVLFTEACMFLAFYYDSYQYLMFRVFIEGSVFAIIMISFLFSTYLINQNAVNSKKTLLINNIKLQLAKDRLEQALTLAAEKELRITAIMDNVADAIITVDVDYKIESFNTSAEKMFGYKKREIIGKSLKTLIPEEYQSEHLKLHEMAVSRDEKFDLTRPRETYRIKRDGEIFPVRITARNIEFNNERLFLGIIQDITEERVHQEEIERFNASLIKARDEAQSANKMKSQLLANITHELRTPMNSILGFSKLILKNINEQDIVKEYTTIIHSNGRRLLALINSILDLSSVESGQTKLHISKFKLKDLVKVIDTLAPLKRDKDITLTFRIDKTLPEEIQADEEKIFQILINLAGNAIKFTERGFVRIHILPSEKNPEKIMFKVEDSGQGISDEHVSHIFEDFYQIEGESQKQKGSGLGLSISKQLVEMMGGTMWVESEENVGSTFYFTIDAVLKGKIEAVPHDVEDKIIHAEDETDFLEDYQRYIDEPILLLCPDSFRSIVMPKFGSLPLDVYGNEDSLLNSGAHTNSVAFLFTETPYQRILTDLITEKIPTVAINSGIYNEQYFLDEGFSDVVSFPLSDSEVDSILQKYSKAYTKPEVVDDAFTQFIKNAIKEILDIQFFRKSDILRELNELIVNSPKKYHTTLKLCIKDVENHNQESYFKRMKELI